MKIYPELNKAMRAGARITRTELKDQSDSGIVLFISLVMALVMILIVVGYHMLNK